MIKLWQKGDYEEAKRVHLYLLPLHKAMFLQTNPIPVKTALALMGKISLELRLPLSPMPQEMVEKLKNILKGFNLI